MDHRENLRSFLKKNLRELEVSKDSPLPAFSNLPRVELDDLTAYLGSLKKTTTYNSLSTAGNVVFGGTNEGQFFALDSETGAELWRASLGRHNSGRSGNLPQQR